MRVLLPLLLASSTLVPTPEARLLQPERRSLLQGETSTEASPVSVGGDVGLKTLEGQGSLLGGIANVVTLRPVPVPSESVLAAPAPIYYTVPLAETYQPPYRAPAWPAAPVYVVEEAAQQAVAQAVVLSYVDSDAPPAPLPPPGAFRDVSSTEAVAPAPGLAKTVTASLGVAKSGLSGLKTALLAPTN